MIFGLPRTRGRDSIERSEPFLRAERVFLQAKRASVSCAAGYESGGLFSRPKAEYHVFRGRRRPSELSCLHRTREREHQDLALFRERSSRSRVKRAKRASLFCAASHESERTLVDANGRACDQAERVSVSVRVCRPSANGAEPARSGLPRSQAEHENLPERREESQLCAASFDFGGPSSQTAVERPSGGPFTNRASETLNTWFSRRTV